MRHFDLDDLADLILVNKADGELKDAATRTAADFRSALQLLHSRHRNWEVPVDTCSALNPEHVSKVWQQVCTFRDTLAATGEFQIRRAEQTRSWMWAEITDRLTAALQSDPKVREQIPTLERHKSWDESVFDATGAT